MPRGGARDGSGRKRLDAENTVTVAVVFTPTDKEYVNSLAGKSFSEKMRKIIYYYRENH